MKNTELLKKTIKRKIDLIFQYNKQKLDQRKTRVAIIEKLNNK